ncbi:MULTISPECIES: hypothetical protein [Microcystis]|jgi:hypothetical protein|uniref:Uncharacterized protein n=1 Tax=Microcystis aeruginosa FD4 TaxID=2686288 RepID=A0A857D485_MICAE|nr:MULTISPECIES: hypothetical protein [Microcystis]NCR23382.1 hypothetical protein [Microcystis aeruginosa L111-01]NCR59658.1 hypothetical protein [Microcystis aeruginosa LL13-06]QGZ90346.1 hypothetical protein GQR42_13165 [Microcystis aeruginosa FD4]
MIYPQYKIIKTALLVVCLAIIFVGSTKQFWPITSWSLYSRYRPSFPSSSATSFQVIVFSNTNQVYEIPLKDILSDEHLDKLTMPLIQKIVDQDEKNSSKKSLVNLIQKTLPTVDINKIEIWELQWTVNPLYLPPLDHEHPKQKDLRSTIVIDG